MTERLDVILEYRDERGDLDISQYLLNAPKEVLVLDKFVHDCIVSDRGLLLVVGDAMQEFV